MAFQEKYRIIDALLLDAPTSNFVNSYIDNLFEKMYVEVDSSNKEIKQVLDNLFKNIDLQYKLYKILQFIVKYGDAYSFMQIKDGYGVEKLENLFPHFTQMTTIGIGKNSSKKFFAENPFEPNVGHHYEGFEVLHFSHDSIFKPILEAKHSEQKIFEYHSSRYLEINEFMIVDKIEQQLNKLCYIHLTTIGYKGDEITNFDVNIKLSEDSLVERGDSSDDYISHEDAVFEILQKLENIENSIKNLTSLSGNKIGKVINNINNRL